MDPLVSTTIADFESEEQAASYDRWFRAEVQASIDDPRPNLTHEQVMFEIWALVEAKRDKCDRSSVAGLLLQIPLEGAIREMEYYD